MASSTAGKTRVTLFEAALYVTVVGAITSCGSWFVR